MFVGAEIIPEEELTRRRRRFFNILRGSLPEAGGIMIFSRVNIYYFTGTMAIGLLWLPLEGEPLLFVRKGLERARLESPALRCALYKSYSRLPDLIRDLGGELPPVLALEQNGLNWTLGLNFARAFKDFRLAPADAALERTRCVKSDWELAKMRLAGERQHEALCRIFPERARPGMSAWQLSRLLWDIYFSLGHSGCIRMAAPGEETFLGPVSVGESGFYPGYFNGPTGGMGMHPAAAYMGYAGEIWNPGDLMITDPAFALEGYISDKSCVYFAGRSGDIPARARAAQDCCMEIQAAAKAGLKPGAAPRELYSLALDIAGRRGFSEGFMGLGDCRVPFLGHGVGLQMDEWPPLAEKFSEPLEENMVIALEPKIALPGLGMLGLEDSFVLTADGCACLSAPRDYAGDIICIE